jgi:SAM-dependent methyltransferase
VAAVYGDNYFQAGGAGYPDYLGAEDLLSAHGKRYGNLLKHYMKPGTVLDVGAAAGFILKGLTESGWKGEGIEPNPRMAAYARSQLGLEVGTGALEHYLPRRQYDVVTMIQVIAHFYDLRGAMEAAAAVTRPNGYWLIETWNKDTLVARRLGENWHEYSPPSVLNWFSARSLRLLAEQYGFGLVAGGRPAKWIKGQHVKSLIGYRLGESNLGRMAAPALKLIPDRLPIPYPSFDLGWWLFQKRGDARPV